MRTTTRRSVLQIGLAVTLAIQLGACALLSHPPPLAPQRLAEIVASPDRSAADRTNDVRRKPEQMLAFIGVRPGMIALDVSAGGGYTSELLARAIGPTGEVYGQSQPRDPNRAPPTTSAPEGASRPAQAVGTAPATMPAPQAITTSRTSATALRERQRRLVGAHVAASPLIPVEQRFDDPVPPALASESLDLVTLMFNYHDLGSLGIDRARMNRAIYRALKPGGIYVIADHAGRPGTGISESGTLHRIEEAFLRKEVEAAGFTLAAEADFLRNASDPRDRNTPDPPMPKDEFVLKFVKR
jgi:predicted methyltransferase